MKAKLIASFVLLLTVFAPTLPAAEHIDIGSRRELFIDHHLIGSLGGVRLVLHRPQPREIVLRFDQPWEGNTSGYVTVMRDGDRLRMIYRGHRMIWDGGKLRMSHSPVVCYAESRDGITWKKPELRLFPWRGNDADKLPHPLANNIVWPGSSEMKVLCSPGSISISRHFRR